MFQLSFDYNCATVPATQFTENFYVNSPVLANAMDRADRLAVLLAKIHGGQTKLMSCSISDTKIARVGTIRYYDDVPSVGSAADNDSDYPTTALQLHLYAADGRHTMQWLKGIPDECVKKMRKALTDSFVRGFGELAIFLKTATNQMAMRVRKTDAPKWRIAGLSTAGEVTLPANDLADGDVIDIVGRGIPKYFRKVWEVVRVDDTHVKLYGAVAQPAFEPGFKGFLRRVDWVGLAIKEVKIGQATEHDVHKEKK